MNDGYEKQAFDFLAKTKSTLTVKFVEYGKHFDDDKENRDIYEITISRGPRSFTFRFGQSIASSGFKLILTSTGKEVKYIWQEKAIIEAKGDMKKFRMLAAQALGEGFIGVLRGFTVKGPTVPNSYDVLSCMTKYDPGSFEDFCGEYGYDVDSRKAEKTYNLVKREYDELCKIFNDKEMQELGEIN
jgi:hypothetical protein